VIFIPVGPVIGSMSGVVSVMCYRVTRL